MRRNFYYLIALVLLLQGCTDRAPGTASSLAGASRPEMAAPPAVREAESRTGKSLEPLWSAKQMIRTVTLDLQVASVDQMARVLARIAEEHEGLVTDTELFEDRAGGRKGTFVLRIPAARLDEATGQLRCLGQVHRETSATNDVTREYIDLQSRLAVGRQAEERLRRLLESRSDTLANVLAVEGELARVVQEIETWEGERRYYDRQIAMSTVSITAREPGAWTQAGPFAPVVEAVRESLDTLATSAGAVIYLSMFLTPWLLLAATGWWIALRFQAFRRRRA